jgi:hypothetical protein
VSQQLAVQLLSPCAQPDALSKLTYEPSAAVPTAHASCAQTSCCPGALCANARPTHDRSQRAAGGAAAPARCAAGSPLHVVYTLHSRSAVLVPGLEMYCVVPLHTRHGEHTRSVVAVGAADMNEPPGQWLNVVVHPGWSLAS